MSFFSEFLIECELFDVIVVDIWVFTKLIIKSSIPWHMTLTQMCLGMESTLFKISVVESRRNFLHFSLFLCLPHLESPEKILIVHHIETIPI